MVAPRARSPAVASATTSPWRPSGSVAPSPTISPSATTTAPTVGFGYARPSAAAASSSALSSLIPAPGGGKAASAPGPAPSSLRRSRERLDQPAVRPRQVLEPEDARPDHEQVGTGLVCGANVLGLDTAVDLDEAVDELPRAREPLVGVLHELLTGVAGIDRHAEADVGALIRRLGGDFHGGAGVEGDPHLEPVLPRPRHHVTHVLHRLDVEGDAVPTRLGDLLEVMRRVVDHQMAVDPAAELVDLRRDRAEHDRANRHRRDEVPVPDVEVEHLRTFVRQVGDLLTEAPEVRRVERRLDLERPDPVAPANAGDPTTRFGGGRRRSRSCGARPDRSAGTPAASGAGTGPSPRSAPPRGPTRRRRPRPRPRSS